MPTLPVPPYPVLSPGQFDRWLNLPAGTLRKLCRTRAVPHFAIRGDYRIVVVEALPVLLSHYVENCPSTTGGAA